MAGASAEAAMVVFVAVGGGVRGGMAFVEVMAFLGVVAVVANR